MESSVRSLEITHPPKLESSFVKTCEKDGQGHRFGAPLLLEHDTNKRKKDGQVNRFTPEILLSCRGGTARSDHGPVLTADPLQRVSFCGSPSGV